ncbi:MAG: FAD-binding oxidoreductase, partial [Deltaproteobacteria bacterium]|nr:FAD-binding oxidoreductase [Deltaproteobacteria bacterium]
LMKRSLAICESFATEMGFNVWFRRGGYLFLVRSEHVFRELSKAVELQRELGLRTRLIDVDEAKAIVPQLNTQGLLCASWNPDDAVVFPWPFVWGYAQAAKKLGVSLTTFTEVIDFELKGNRILGVLTSKGRIQSNHVILCTGAWTSGLARRIGVEVPSHPHRHEICSSEPLKPFLGPLVGDLENGLYFSQSMRGEIVGGIANPKVPPGLNQESSSHFLARYAHALLKVIPILGHVKIVRQWAGCYDITPDGHPICGEVEEVRGLYLLSGFMGHGFMMAPAMGESFAKYFLFGEERQLFERWNLRRFRDGKLLRETMILG